MSEPAYRNAAPAEVLDLIRDDAVHVVDVRTPGEFQVTGHIPGADLLPVELIACGAATLPRDGRPVLVTCEHGVRSVQAARFLARAGHPDVINMTGGMSRWTGPRQHSPGDPFTGAGPSSWLVKNADLLPRSERVLDVACGSGRHALLLGAAGFRVHAVDRDTEAISRLADTARRLGLDLQAEVVDLEKEPADLDEGAYGTILGFHYLHRPLFPALVRALRPGGILLYETFTREQARHGGPHNPTYLLEPGELAARVRPLEVVRRREGQFHGRMVAAVAALR
jgi:rhodanese-related sulfurtransferase